MNKFFIKFSVLFTLIAFFASEMVNAQTTRNVGNYSELTAAITASANNDIINFTDNIVISNEITVDKSLVFNGNDYTISVETTGLSDDGVINDNPSTYRVFNINVSGGTVFINNLTIKGGATGSGSGIYISSGTTVKISESLIRNCKSTSGGGGIVNQGTLFLSKVKLFRNAASYGGGFLNHSTMFVEYTSITENRSTSTGGGGGGGENSGYIYFNNSTFSNNQSTEIGGGINNNSGTIWAVNTTFTGNVAFGNYPGGAIGNNGGTIKLANCLFAYNYRRDGGSVTNPTSYALNDIGVYSGSYAEAYYCLFQSLDGVSSDASNVQYTGAADGSDNNLIAGGSYTKIKNGEGEEIGTAKVFQPFLVKAANGIETIPLYENGFATQATNRGTRTGYTNNNGVNPVMGYYDGSSWIAMTGTNPQNYEVLVDQEENTRTDPTTRGATETEASDLFMLKITSTPNGNVDGASIFGDVYVSGTVVTITAYAADGYKFDSWNYQLGGTGTASSDNPYNVTVDRDITLEPVFSALGAGEYSITYFGNGNTGGNAPDYAIYTGTTTILGKNTLVKTGYEFQNWNTEEYGGGTTYNEGDVYSAGSNLELYAQWEEVSAPLTPVATAATNITGTSFTANWNAVADATGYYLDVDDNADFSSPITGYNNLDVSDVLTYNVTGLNPVTTYYYRIRAYNAGGTSDNSNVINLTTTKLDQTITFGTLDAKTYGDASYTISATATSGLDVVFTSSNTNIATCTGTNGTTITIIGAGNCDIYANQAGNDSYNPAPQVTQNLTVNKKALTLTDASVTDKVYDATTDAEITGTLTGIIGSETVTLIGTGNFASANIGTGIAVTSTSTLGGADAGNYTLTQPTGLTGDITAKELTVTDASVTDKVYDATTDAEITGTLTGIIGSETVTLIGTGNFASANVGTGIAVTSTSTLGGADAGNYTLTQPTGLTGDITAKEITVTADANQSKYFGEDDPVFTYTESPNLETGDSFTGALSRVAGEDIGFYAITIGSLTAGSNYSITFVSEDFEIKAPENVKNLSETEISVYPNPTTGIFTIETEGNFDVTITDISGKEILKFQNFKTSKVDLSDNANGVYFIKFQNNETVKTVKIIKQ